MVNRKSYSTERRLMIDMAAIREAYDRHEIDCVAHVPGVNNPADALTKLTQSKALISMMEGNAEWKVAQWISRAPAERSA